MKLDRIHVFYVCTWAGVILSAAVCLFGCRTVLPPYRTEIRLQDAHIQLSPDAGPAAVAAAGELQRHLQILTGIQSPVNRSREDVQQGSDSQGFTFYVDQAPPGARSASAGAMARGAYRVTKRGVYFWRMPIKGRRSCKAEKCGGVTEGAPRPLYAAVSEFLGRDLEFRWIAPEKRWTYCKKSSEELRTLRLGRLTLPTYNGRLVLSQADALTPAERRQIEQWAERFGHKVTSSHVAAAPLRLELLPLPLGMAAGIYDRICRRNSESELYLDGLPGGLFSMSLRDYAALHALRNTPPGFDAVLGGYADAFGPAHGEVREYCKFWIAHYRDAVSPKLAALGPLPSDNMLREVYRRAAEFYPEERFADASALLHRAAAHSLNERQKGRLDCLLLSHTHLQMLLDVLRTLDSGVQNPGKFEQGIRRALRLRDFRKRFGRDLGPAFELVSAKERAMADVTGLEFAGLFERADTLPVLRVGPQWFVAPERDTENAAQPPEASIAEVRSWPVWINRPEGTEPLRAEGQAIWLAATFKFDGDMIRNRYALNFWALARPAEVYLNGVKLGSLRASAFVDAPFTAWRVEIPRDAFDASAYEQTLLVKLTPAVRVDPVAAWRAVWISETALGDSQ